MKVSPLLLIGMSVLIGIPMPAVAQGGFGSLFKMPADGHADGRYLSNNQIRTYVTADPHDPFDLPTAVREKAALMTQAKGFPIFAVIKKRCFTTLYYGIPQASSCYWIAQMLNEGETVKHKKGEPVEYITVADVIAARIKRFEKRAGIADTAE